MSPKRVDRNQSQIVAALREVGATVTPTHMVGRGYPDISVGFRGNNYLIEIKSPRGKLTPDEIRWHDEWRGQVAIVRTVDDAFKVIGL